MSVRGSDGAAAKKVEGRGVIGDGAPFDAQPRSLGVQGRSQAAGLNKPEKRIFKANTAAREKLRMIVKFMRGAPRPIAGRLYVISG